MPSGTANGFHPTTANKASYSVDFHEPDQNSPRQEERDVSSDDHSYMQQHGAEVRRRSLGSPPPLPSSSGKAQNYRRTSSNLSERRPSKQKAIRQVSRQLSRQLSVPGDIFLAVSRKFVIGYLEKFFYKLGTTIASHPFKVICATLLLCVLGCVGLIYFEFETDAEKLWLPRNASFVVNKEWKSRNFPDNMRDDIVLLKSNDGASVLTPEAMLKLLSLHREVRELTVDGKRFEDICSKVAITDITLARRKRRRRRDAFTLDGRTENNQPNSRLTTNSIPDPISSSTETPKEQPDEYNIDNFNWYTGGVEERESEDDYNDLYDFNFYTGEESTYDEDLADADKASGEHIDNDDDDEEDEDDGAFADRLPPEVYCDLIETLSDKCGEYSLLEIWKYDEARIRALSVQDIVDAVNTVDESPVFGYDTDFTDYLGGIKRNSSGHLVSAESVRSVWRTTFDPKQKVKDATAEFGITGSDIFLADQHTMNFERNLIQLFANFSDALSEDPDMGFTLLYSTPRSFSDIVALGVEDAYDKLAIGYIFMFAYTMFVVSQLSRVGNRAYLAIAGILSVVFGLGFSFGVMMALGFKFNQVHGVLPFLAMGIGIDDMFVIVQCLKNIESGLADPSSMDPKKKIGLTLQKAGVAITLTSVTDIMAFVAGSFTILPGLYDFCLMSAATVGAIFFFQTTWFVACLTLDQRRIASERDGCFPCCTVRRSSLSKAEEAASSSSAATERCRESRFSMKSAMGFTSRVLRHWQAQVGVILVTLSMLSACIYGSYNTKIDFQHKELLTYGSYLRNLWATIEEDFPESDIEAIVYSGGISYTLDDFEKIEGLIAEFERYQSETDLLDGVDFWWTDLKEFMSKRKNATDWRAAIRDGRITTYLSDFLLHRDGGENKDKFIFERDLVCGEPASGIKSVKLGSVTYRELDNTADYLPVRRRVEEIIQQAEFPTHTFSDNKHAYSAWTTNETIGHEMIRNLGVAIVAVIVVNALMLADFKLCFMVFLCVLFTLIDVTGICFYLGQNIDVISCICNVLVIGFCVDYCVHIAHAYLVSYGDRKERATAALTEMGPAIFNGGLTTFIALFLLAFSNYYAYTVFFRIFSMTVFFGLFHGLLFLPTILMLFGSTKLESKAKAGGLEGSSPPPTEASTVDTSVEASPHLGGGTVNGGFSQGLEEKSNLATNLLLRLQSRAQQSWDLPASFKSNNATSSSSSSSQQNMQMQHPTV